MIARIRELQGERVGLVKRSREILDKAANEKRAMTVEESANYDKAMTDITNLATQIEREQRQMELEREIAGQRAEETRKEDGKDKPKTDAEVRNAAYAKWLRGGVSVLNEVDHRALQADNLASGGYLVPPEQQVVELIKAIDNEVFIRQFARKFMVADAQTLGAPVLDNDPADADWTSELATGSEDSTMSFAKRSLTPHPLAKRIKVSNKLMRTGAMGPEELVRSRLAYKFGVSQEKGFLTGNGASQPLGVFTASALGISTGRDVSTDNTTGEIRVDGLKNAKYSIKGQYWPRLRWIFHRDALKQISKLKDGEGRYIWEASVQVGQPDRLLNFPVHMSEYAPNTFTTGLYVGILGDFSNYWIADALSMQMQRLIELYAEANQVGFIGRLETDGMPVLEEAFARVTLS